MNINETDFNDLFLIDYKLFDDKRGAFVKTIHEPSFTAFGLSWQFAESFYSISKKNVIRGMHYQQKPYSHSKLVYVIKGKIIDVVLDIRNHSETFGKCFSVELSAENCKAIYIGEGFAHGFLSLEEDSIVEYHTTTVQSKEAEAGINWNSFNYNWGINDPILSDRDNALQNFDAAKEYFI